MLKTCKITQTSVIAELGCSEHCDERKYELLVHSGFTMRNRGRRSKN